MTLQIPAKAKKSIECRDPPSMSHMSAFVLNMGLEHAMPKGMVGISIGNWLPMSKCV